MIFQGWSYYLVLVVMILSPPGVGVVSWRGRGFHIYFSLDRPDWRMKEINIMLIKKTYTKFYRNIRLVNVFFHP